MTGGAGPVTLMAPAGTGTVSASKRAGCVLTNTSLSSGDGMNLTLSGISTANLTTTTTKGAVPRHRQCQRFLGERT